jgi:hypothetical protein
MDVVQLNVGGKVFLTTRRTLGAERGSMLAIIFDPRPFHHNYNSNYYAEDLKIDLRECSLKDRSYFFDRPHLAFDYVLNYLRCNLKLVQAPPPEIMSQLRNDAVYFQLDGLLRQCDALLNVKPQYEVLEINSEMDREGITILKGMMKQGWYLVEQIQMPKCAGGTITILKLKKDTL